MSISPQELQVQVDDEQRAREDLRDQFQLTERRCNSLLAELEELRAALESSERSRKLAEAELSESSDRVSELTVSVHSLTAQRRKVESELSIARSECEEAQNDARNRDEQAKKAMTDVRWKSQDSTNNIIKKVQYKYYTQHCSPAQFQIWILYNDYDTIVCIPVNLSLFISLSSLFPLSSVQAMRLAEELRAEQDHAMHSEKMRKSLEITLKDMQARLDEAEAMALKGGKRIIAKLETRVRKCDTSFLKKCEINAVYNLIKYYIKTQRSSVRIPLQHNFLCLFVSVYNLSVYKTFET